MITVKYRPIKIGLCIQENDFVSLRKGIELSNALIGGGNNPFIPINNIDLAKKIISQYKVDFLYSLDKSSATKQFIDQFPHLSFFSLDDFNESFDENFVNVQDIHQYISKKIKIYKWDLNDELSDIFLINFGNYFKHIENCDYCSKLLAEVIKIKLNSIHPILDYENHYNILTNINSINHFPQINSKNFYIGEAGNFEDLITYWNLKASGLEIIFYDPNMKERFENILPNYNRNYYRLWMRNNCDLEYSEFNKFNIIVKYIDNFYPIDIKHQNRYFNLISNFKKKTENRNFIEIILNNKKTFLFLSLLLVKSSYKFFTQ